MATLADIHAVAENDIVSAFCDDSIPAGPYFGATAKVLGITTVYLLEGEMGAEDAVIRGRIELPPVGKSAKRTDFAIGGNLKGGKWGGLFISAEDAFAKMV